MSLDLNSEAENFLNDASVLMESEDMLDQIFALEAMDFGN